MKTLKINAPELEELTDTEQRMIDGGAVSWATILELLLKGGKALAGGIGGALIGIGLEELINYFKESAAEDDDIYLYYGGMLDPAICIG